jgi:Uncharacterised nucleotidyltransferase
MTQIGLAERKLLLLCTARGDSGDERIRELSASTLDWNSIFLSALWHKVAFLVLARLRATGAMDIAISDGNLHLLLLNHWKQLSKVNKIRSELYAAAAVRIASAARERGVALAVSKGAIALFGSVYTYEERKAYDVDYVGRRSEIRGIEEALAQAGFSYGEYSHSREAIEPPRPDSRRKYLLQGRGLPNFLNKPDSDVIDYMVAQVRFRVGSGSVAGNWISADPMLDRAEGRNGITVLAWDDLAVQLALHIHREVHEAEYQTWNLDWNLIKLCDLDRILHFAPGQNLPGAAASRALELGFGSEVAFAAHVTNEIFPSPATEELIRLCGGWDATAAAYDSAAIDKALWSIGDVNQSQDGAWVQLAGPKTT